MKSDTLQVQQIFQHRSQYRVPFYQRAYVWTRGDQWERLWEDIRDKAEARIMREETTPHFLGAVVLEPQTRSGIRGVDKYHIIDGQQRLTTLQYVLHGLLHALRATGTQGLASLVEACVRNPHPETMHEPAVEGFKVWPTFRDRTSFEAVLTAATPNQMRERFPASFKDNGEIYKRGTEHPPALEALWFFFEECRQWIEAEDSRALRAEALVSAALTDLSLVCITLGPDDDAQVIFETLNGHAAKLHATDLIRNFVFMRAGGDAERLYQTQWRQFESPTWSAEQTRGRLKRPRLEWFVQTTLQAESGNEVDVGRIYHAYREFANGAIDGKVKNSSQQLDIVCRFAEPYLELATGEGTSPIATFGARLAPWDASTMHALALRIAVAGIPLESQGRIYEALESYIARRAICGLSSKYYNRIFQQILKLTASTADIAAIVVSELSKPHQDSMRWPRDDEFRRACIQASIYPGNLDAQRTRAVLTRIESSMRSGKSEEAEPHLHDDIDVEHILPTSWFDHWPLTDETRGSEKRLLEARAKRIGGAQLETSDALVLARGDSVSRMGNLTLLRSGLNRGIQNHAFPHKREEYFANSNLHLNRGLMRRTTWDEQAIEQRGTEMAETASRIWPGPT